MADKWEEERKHIDLPIGQRLRKFRKEEGLIFDVLAEKTDFSKSNSSQIENLKGKREWILKYAIKSWTKENS